MTGELHAKLAQLIGAFTAHVLSSDPACRVEWSREQAPARVTWYVRAAVDRKRVRGMSQQVLLTELEDAPIDHVIACQMHDFDREWPL